MDALPLLILALGTWRLSSMFAREAGPGALFRRMREACGVQHDDRGAVTAWPETFLASLITCVWCSSVWIGTANVVLLALWPMGAVWLNFPLAVSTVAIVVDRIVQEG